MSHLQLQSHAGKEPALSKLADDAETSIKAIKDLVLDARVFGRQG
jgi:hypothetical protein